MLATLALALAACGADDETIPRSNAENLLSALDTAESALAAGECETVSQAALEFSVETGRLPLGVERQLRSDLARGAQQLLDLVDECEPAEEVEEPEPIEPEPVEPEPVEPEPVEPEPEPDQPEREPREPREDEQDGPGQGGQGGQNQGGGGGGAGGGIAPPGAAVPPRSGGAR